jgi:signal peptide peptidase SppA
MKQLVIADAVSDSLWAGDDSSLQSMIARASAIDGRTKPEAAGQVVTYGAAAEQEEMPYLLTKDGPIGIIAIKGPITNQTSYWDKYDMAATYPAIREALIYAANDASILSVLLDVDSGGGAVSGVDDTASLIRNINENVKPVTAYTEQNMYSAAYWLGCSAGSVFASKSAGTGSIGIIGTHMDMSKMYEQMGINVTVIRAGKFKALASKFEPLSKEARAQIQRGIDMAYTVFIDRVSAMREVSYEVADKKLGDGQEFFGQEGVTAGLLDGITTFDALMSELNSGVDNQQGFTHNSQNNHPGLTMTKKALTDAQIAALASGVQPQAAAQGVVVEAAAAPAVVVPAAAPAVAAVIVAEPAAAAPAAAAAAPVAAPVAAVAVPAAPAADVMAYLQGQIATKDAALMSASIENATLKSKVTEFEASLGGLLAIACKSANNMRVALGGSASDMKALTATQVLAQHEATAKEFETKYVAGGIAAVDAAQKPASASNQPSALEVARLNAVMAAPRKK